QIVVRHFASRSIRLANAAGSSSKVRYAAAALRTAAFSTSTSAMISASRLSSKVSPCNFSSMRFSSRSQPEQAFAEPRLVFRRERHDPAQLLIELHADGFRARRQGAGLGLEQEMGEGQHFVGEGGQSAHYHYEIAGTKRPAIVVQHLDHDCA